MGCECVVGADTVKDRTILVWPDTHIPTHDKRAVALMLNVVINVQPDEILLLGDFIDCKAPARWSKGTAAEYADTLPQELEAAKEVLTGIRSIHSGDLTFLEGNHEARIASYLRNYAPAIKGLVPSLNELLSFEENGVQYRDQPYQVAPGFLAIHGNKLSSTQNSAGQSAWKERLRHGSSIVQGHSHRAGIVADTQGKRRYYAMECGHLMDVGKAHYLDFKGISNWQQAFGILRVVDGRTFPELHYIDSGKAVVNGQTVRA